MKGISSARRRLLALPLAVGQAADRALQESLDQAWRYARKVVPVRTGRLRASLQKQVSPSSCALTTHCPYAVYVELGTRYAAAQPYLRPAARQADFVPRAAALFREVLK